MLPKDAKYMPAIRITFTGKDQSDYFSLNKIATEDFETNQTALARLIITEWLRDYREKKKAGKSTGTQQMVMILRGEKPKPKAKAGKE
jgi:hypothetical protein